MSTTNRAFSLATPIKHTYQCQVLFPLCILYFKTCKCHWVTKSIYICILDTTMRIAAYPGHKAKYTGLAQLVRLVRPWPYQFLWQSYKELLQLRSWTVLSALYRSLVSVQSAIIKHMPFVGSTSFGKVWSLHLVSVACASASTCSKNSRGC